MNYEEIVGLTANELKKRKKDLRQQMFEIRMKNALGQLTNPMQIRVLRRDIARLNTAMTSQKASLQMKKTTVKSKARKG